MKKVEDYLDHAAECRALARATSLGEQRRQLEEMARTWEQLADARRRELNKPSALLLCRHGANRPSAEGLGRKTPRRPPRRTSRRSLQCARGIVI
jgi:hypothetical protein